MTAPAALRPMPLLAAALLAGCAGGGPFPSLSPRAAEYDAAEGRPPPPCLPGQGPGATIAPIPAPVQVDDASVAGRIAALMAEARAGQADFAATLPEASASAAKAGGTGSDTWVAAQQDLSRLGAARTRTSDALAELDALALDRSDKATGDADAAALATAVEEAQRLASGQQAELDRIGALLNPL